eukprot:CAMPEP_0194199366 /NCGR_PEP_ID=MMETSP0156-20130528/412_1 /TAXON_ID=33649 /ORGANISM="Thalassionema nitzschioides, Strain L26-B" /LENGTH=684 /DNA_ID=CAMNT_0038924251 /DNA_START=70 /DNA_END=2127 /DNA_ORIENTATION=-
MKFIRINGLLLTLVMARQEVSGGFIDMDTPLEARTTRSLVDKSVYNLVMSDEFNTPGRTFKDGHDPVWTALDKSDDDSSSAGGGSLQFYNSSFVTTTKDGMLKIESAFEKTEWNRFDHVQKQWKVEKSYFNSGMMQSWEKFCFTGGIVEIDIIFPGDPYIGGLWPAVWMLGNLGRATYEASTNNIWPWSFDTCDRKLQDKQTISACNEHNHFGMHPRQGRGATEIDIVEVMTGDSGGPFDQTDPPVELPYADFTLQVAPGIVKNRPQSGSLPARKDTVNDHGQLQFKAQTWYDGLVLKGNTSINPFFYGTYLDETKPGEPVTRTKEQAFQADAVGVVHQLTPAHFNRTHTFRVEWQPGRGGRLDWFVKAHKIKTVNGTSSMEGDGLGDQWTKAFTLKDESLDNLMGSKIPIEPSYLIMNVAISSTWGFPYDVPKWCAKCFDCNDPKCSCAFHPGFCNMLQSGDTAMYLDHIRVYQSNDPSAHVGGNHTLGCDPPEYPTKEWIEGHEYRYMRNPPFVYEDKKPLRKVQRGGGVCKHDADCGGNITNVNLTAISQSILRRTSEEKQIGRGKCVQRQAFGKLFSTRADTVCKCNTGYTGPYCMAQHHIDDTRKAKEFNAQTSPFSAIANLQVTPSMWAMLITLILVMLVSTTLLVMSRRSTQKLKELKGNEARLVQNAAVIMTGTLD